MSSVDVLFGKAALPVSLPASVTPLIIRKPAMPVVSDPIAAVNQALAQPVKSPALSELARSAKSASIVICDITRPVPNGLLLPPLIRTLLDAGISKEKINVLVATGLHRPNLGEELRELVGSDWVLETVKVENHYARRDEEHTFLGTTPRGTRVGIDRRFVEADLKIVTGLVEPHFMAGYSGGRKVISPGIAHADTIRTFHNTVFMENPLARNCNLDGNPLHDEQLEIVRKLGQIYAVNTVLDDERRLAHVNFGDILSSHESAVAFVRRYAEAPIPKPYPVVITSCAGYPLDKTYYQTVKGIVGALNALQPGGRLLIASECSEGLGSEEFLEAQETLVRLGVEKFMDEARQRPLAKIDEWQTVKLAEALRRGEIHLYSPHLTSREQHATGLHCHATWEEAVQSVMGSASEVAIIPEGPYVIPMVKE